MNQHVEHKEPPLSYIAGLPFHHTTMEAAMHDFVRTIRGDKPSYWITPNVDFATRAASDPILKDIVFHADRIFCDGLPLVWLSKLYDHPLPERVAGSDMVPRMLETSAKEGFKVYFLGSDDETLAKSGKTAQERYPGLQIVGQHAPPFAHVHEWDNDQIVADINESGADLVLVAVGSPKQERWISAFHRKTKAKLTIGIGASLDFIAGSQVRAPRFVQRIGFEWLWRMLSDPKRLAKRYASNFPFLGKAALSQWRAYRRRYQPSDADAFGNEDTIDLTKVDSLNPEILAQLISSVRSARREGLVAPRVLASEPLQQALVDLGLIPPLRMMEEGEESLLVEAGASVQRAHGPREWRAEHWDDSLDDDRDLIVDLSSTTFIDYPTLWRLRDRKLALEKQQLSLKMEAIMPDLEMLLGSLGFSSLLTTNSTP